MFSWESRQQSKALKIPDKPVLVWNKVAFLMYGIIEEFPCGQGYGHKTNFNTTVLQTKFQ